MVERLFETDDESFIVTSCQPPTWCRCNASAFYRAGRAWRCMRCQLRAEHRIGHRIAGGLTCTSDSQAASPEIRLAPEPAEGA